MHSVSRILLAAALLLPSLGLADWPQFRGPNGDGKAPEGEYPVEFSATEGVRWSAEIPGKGWSSPVVADGKVWITTAIETEATEAERQALLEKAGVEPKKYKQKQVAAKVKLQALSLDLATGEITRAIDLIELGTPDPIHNLNSYASPTPVLEDGRLFCHFGSFGTICLDTETGQRLWERKFTIEHGVGPGSSPFLYRGLLVLICDGVDKQFVVAVDKNSGETIWKTDRPAMRAASGDQKKAYCTPVVVEGKDGDDQLICMGSQWLVSYEPLTGKERWRCDHGSGFSVVPRPVIGHGRVYVSTGFGKPELWAVRHDGRGDVSKTHVDWTQEKRIPAKPSPLLVGDEIYVLSDGGIASCLDAATGEPHWVERVGGNYSASPLLAGGHIYLCSQEGTVTVLRPGKEFGVVTTNEMGTGIMASPAAVEGGLLLRTEKGLLRVGE